jgi:hypothetical protein
MLRNGCLLVHGHQFGPQPVQKRSIDGIMGLCYTPAMPCLPNDGQLAPDSYKYYYNSLDHYMTKCIQLQFLFVIPFGKIVGPVLDVFIVLLLRFTRLHQFPGGNPNGHLPVSQRN